MRGDPDVATEVKKTSSPRTAVEIVLVPDLVGRAGSNGGDKDTDKVMHQGHRHIGISDGCFCIYDRTGITKFCYVLIIHTFAAIY